MKTRPARHPAWRVAAVVLVLANIGYFAWSRGAFAAFGLQPSRLTESEPYRMARQVRPEMLQVLKEVPQRPAPAAVAPAPTLETLETPAATEPPTATQPPAAPGPAAP